MQDDTQRPVVKIRIYFGSRMMGPGKAELLEHIDNTGSISAAGREMAMSYKRAWMLVEALNAMFREPVVLSTRGGPQGGGAVLTETGRRVLALYREYVANATASGAPVITEMQSMLSDISEQK